MKKEKLMCCLCNQEIKPCPRTGWDKGHNPAPLGEEGDRCCDRCNNIRVLPTRLLDAMFIDKVNNNKN